MKHFLFVIICCLSCQLKAQSKDIDIRELFSSIVFINDSIPVTNEINGKEYEIILKDPINGKLKNLKAFKLGSGFFISKNLDIYLVTAAHVAKNLSVNTKLIYQGKNGKKREVTIKNLTGSIGTKVNWILHPSADVAVLHIPLKIIDTDYFKSLKIGMIGHTAIMDKLEGPDRLKEVTVFGFPFGLGVLPNSISPITKNLRPSSDIIYLQRFDNKIINPFFLLDDPSISGFSGGPVMHVVENPRNGFRPDIGIEPTITGLVHGTINDKTGGLAAIVPGIKIIETIELAPSYNGIYIYHYPNGSVWSKVIYKNGIPWEVISNFAPDGKPQDMGTLKKGTGTLNIYNEEGEQIWMFFFKNGKAKGNAGIMTKTEKEKYGINKN
ncbi:MAG: serine protease [Flavobacteriaceae bacterium]|nr:serine protease [Flavobacteriaceae bacterium]